MLEAAALPPMPIRILSQTAFFAGLTAEQLERVSSISRFEEREKGRQIYNIGEPGKILYVLIEGMVRFAIGYGTRNASAGDILRRGQVFGWAALTPRANLRLATASCLTPCTVLAIDGDSLLSLMEEDHTMGYRIMQQFSLLITGTLTAFAAG